MRRCRKPPASSSAYSTPTTTPTPTASGEHGAGSRPATTSSRATAWSATAIETCISRIVAVEFEAIYAVSHPGRRPATRFRDLRRLKRLLEGPSSSRDAHARVDAERGHRLVDSGRARRAAHRVRTPSWFRGSLRRSRCAHCGTSACGGRKGWFQVSYRYLLPGLASRKVTFRQEAGAVPPADLARGCIRGSPTRCSRSSSSGL